MAKDYEKEIAELKSQLNELKKQQEMKMFFITGGYARFMGNVGELTDIKDSKGEFLYTGDVIRLWGFEGEDKGTKSIVKEGNEYFIPGIKDCPKEAVDKLFVIEKVKDYKDIRKGYRTQKVVYCYSKDEAKEISLKEREFVKEVFKVNEDETKKALDDLLKKFIEKLESEE